MKKTRKTISTHLVLDKQTIRDLVPHELSQMWGGDPLPTVAGCVTRGCPASHVGCTSTCPM